MTVYHFSPITALPRTDAINTNLKTLALSDGFRAQMLAGTADRSLSVERLCSCLIPAPDARSTILLLSADHDLQLSPAAALDNSVALPTAAAGAAEADTATAHAVDEVVDFSYGIIVSLPLLEDGCAATVELIADVEELVLPGEEMSEQQRQRYYYALELARVFAARAERSLLTTWLEQPPVDTGDDQASTELPYAQLLQHAGFSPVLHTVQGYVPLPVTAPTAASWERLHSALAKDGNDAPVRFEYFCDELPSHMRQQVTELYALADSDAPRRDFVGENERWDRGRLDAITRLAQENGTRTHFGLLLSGHGEASSVLALSVIAQATGSREDVAEQNVTVTARSVRGCGAGLLVKQELLRTLHAKDPRLARVYTSVEVSNKPMLAVNTALGFHPISRASAYQRRRALSA
ncbi:hypothetical protein [Corynebacterium sp. TAE3-ERU2]|uniref:hypothetical protein n=1 Tax=Corynebacterium sp. TAE3-ERU2 TaxID=2849497 RepID=UPI001C483009|nr:hypothetical protein [Corynebacterium sp. TAE3-ERU2]MBV7301653.1 hypothetical protein [Corynebacterium sp. TAE3-ERU2]